MLLNQNEEFIITSKVQPIIKAWLADSFRKAKSEIDQFEYKSDGLVMSDIYFIHLALINNFYKKVLNKKPKFTLKEKRRLKREKAKKTK